MNIHFLPAPAYNLKMLKRGGELFNRKIISAAVICAVIFSLCGCGETTSKYVNNNTVGIVSAVPMGSAVDVKGEGISDSACAAVIYCADNGEVLYGHNINDKRAIASITKIMTAVIALEYCASKDKDVKITADMYAEGSSMYLKAGEIIKLSEIVKGMMAVSGNDAANAVAVTVGGNSEKFAEMMNEKAQQIGMKNTHFVTPSGLDSEQHYSTAYDMAVLCSYAMDNEVFREIVSQKTVDVEYVYPESKKQTLVNHNRLLSMCEGCIGIKTGYTMKAGRTLTSCAERDGVRLIVVTLGDGNDWNDHCALYDYGFGLVQRAELTGGNKSITLPLVGNGDNSDEVCLVPDKKCEVTLKNGDVGKVEEKIYAPHFVYAPLTAGEAVGEIEYKLNDRVIAKARLVVK